MDTAVSLVDRQGLEGEASYNYINEPVMGGYNPSSGLSPEDFKQEFARSFGVEPSVVSAQIQVLDPETSGDGTDQQSLTQNPTTGQTSGVIPITIDTSSQRVDPQAASPLAIENLTAIPENIQAGPQPSPSLADEIKSPYWMPAVVWAQTYRSGDWQYVTMRNKWAIPNYSIRNIDKMFGVEFGVNLLSDLPALQGDANVRGMPSCPADARDQFLAKNYNWASWQFIPTGWTMANGDPQPYADYNDLSDLCRRQSLSVGIRNPTNMPDPAAANESDVTIIIQAPAGNAASNAVSAEIQIVDNASCPETGANLTDCMGLNPHLDSGNENPRSVLAESRGWTAAPNLCWVSQQYGRIDPIQGGPACS